jgi:hypothetical protein
MLNVLTNSSSMSSTERADGQHPPISARPLALIAVECPSGGGGGGGGAGRMLLLPDFNLESASRTAALRQLHARAQPQHRRSATVSNIRVGSSGSVREDHLKVIIALPHCGWVLPWVGGKHALVVNILMYLCLFRACLGNVSAVHTKIELV